MREVQRGAGVSGGNGAEGTALQCVVGGEPACLVAEQQRDWETGGVNSASLPLTEGRLIAKKMQSKWDKGVL